MAISDNDSDMSDDDLLSFQPMFQQTSKSEKKKNEKLHKFLDSYLEKEEKRFAQKELIRDMKKDVHTENPATYNDKDSLNDSINLSDLNSSSYGDKGKELTNRTQNKKRKDKSCDAIDEEYRRIMEENGKLNREIRRRRLRNAADGIDLDYRSDENKVDESLFQSHAQHGEIFENEKDAERNKEIFAAKITGYSSKLGSRLVLYGRQYGTMHNQTKENSSQQKRRISGETKNDFTRQLSNFLVFYESEDTANEALKQIISNFSKKNRHKLAKNISNVLLLPIERAIKKKVISFFLQHGTLKKVYQNACDLLYHFYKDNIIASKTGNYLERYMGQIRNFFNLLSEIVRWLWHVCVSSGCPNNHLSLSFRQGAYLSLSILMQTDFFTTLEATASTKMLKSLYETIVFSSFSFQNFLKGFQLACGYKCPVSIEENNLKLEKQSQNLSEALDEKTRRKTDDTGNLNETIDHLLIRQYLEIWVIAFKYGHIHWKEEEYTQEFKNKKNQNDCSDKLDSLSQLATECFEVLLFSSLDYCFYSGNLLLESLESLIQLAIHYIYCLFKEIDSNLKHCTDNSDAISVKEDSTNELFFIWLKNTAHQIIFKCRHLTTGAPSSNDEDDSKGWLALALLVWNVPIFRNDMNIDILSTIFKATMAEFALHLGLFNQMLFPTLSTIGNEDNKKRCETEASWGALLKKTAPSLHTLMNRPDKSCNKCDHISYSTWQFFLASKCITLAEIGINRKYSQNIQKEGPRLYAVTLIAHICAEIGNSLFVFPNQDKTESLIQNLSFLMCWDGNCVTEESKHQLQSKNGKLPSLYITDQNEFMSIYTENLKIMHDRLASLEEQCLKTKKDITMVFTNPHLRRVKEFLVWLATTYRQWRLESAKIIGEEERHRKLVPVQSNLKEWLHVKNEN